MKMTSISCPTCGAGIKIDIKGRDTLFCPYCGSQILFEDDITISQNINIHTRHTEDAEIERERRIDRQNEREHREFTGVMFGLMLVLFLCIGLLVLLYFKWEADDKKAVAEGKIQIGISSSDIEEDKTKYQGIVSQLEASGFSNITVIDLDDAGIFTKKADTIDSISVDGDSSFSSHDYFNPDAKIIISYH